VLTVADAQPFGRILTVSEEMRLAPGNEFQECSLCPRMIVVPAGKFVMGAPIEEGRYVTEQPLHEVTIARPFAVGKAQPIKIGCHLARPPRKALCLALLNKDLHSRRAKVPLLCLLEREERVNDDRFG